MPRCRLMPPLITRPFDTIGDWNPQLLRELKGRCKRFPVMTAIGLSLLVQGVLALGFIGALPGAIAPQDLILTTYPQISWSSAAHLSASVQTQVLPSDEVEERVLRAKALFINHIGTEAAIWGQSAPGQAALQQLQEGDRLVALDGQPVAQLEAAIKAQVSGDPDAIWVEQHVLAHQGQVADLMRGSNRARLSEASMSRLDTTVVLTLYRPGRGEFTVELPRVATLAHWSNYCLPAPNDRYQCQLTADQQAYRTNWHSWYRDVFIALSGVMVLPLMGIGSFLLTSNLVEEQRRGTLNFVRMSPRSALTVLSGKLLGVPICLYLAIAAMFPLQTLIGLAAGFSGAHLIGFDIALLSQTAILYMLALLLGLTPRAPMLMSLMPWLVAVGGLSVQGLMALLTRQMWDGYTPATPLNWAVLFSPLGSAGYFIDLGQWVDAAHSFDWSGSAPPFQPAAQQRALSIFRVNFWEYTGLTVLHAGGWGLVLGHALQRRFAHPTQALLARRYSYGLTGVFMVMILGVSATAVESYDLFPVLFCIAVFCVFYGLVLVLSLTCDRQTLQDWARFRTARLPHQGRLPLGPDLLIGDTSSPVLAIGLNLLLMVTLFSAWFLLHHRAFLNTKLELWSLVGSVALCVGSIFFAVLTSQVLLLTQRQKGWFWFSSIGSMSCLLFPALTLAIGVGLVPARLSGMAIGGLPPEVAVFIMPLSLMGGLTLMLAVLHWRQLVLVGRSEYQQLVMGDRAATSQRLR